MLIQADKKTHRLHYPTGAQIRPTAVTEVGDDDLLYPGDTAHFSPDAARIACALSMSASDEEMLRENLTVLGFGETAAFAFSDTNGDKAGLCLSSCVCGNTLRVIAVVRGTEQNEWFSNFDVGYSSEHTGFAKAADFAELRLGDYVFTRAIGTDVRFFVTGYSRGGAVANILSKRLCDRYGLDNVSCYTFASPCTTVSRRVGRYGCIFNLVRGEDFFTRIPPERWGYTRYGRTLSLTGCEIKKRFFELTGEDYIGFTGAADIDSFLCATVTLAPNVRAYYERRREVGGQRLSLYEFLCAVAQMLSYDMDENVADLFLSAMVSDYADVLSFLSTGADLNEILSSAGGAPRCSVADSHSPAAYTAALEAFLAQ